VAGLASLAAKIGREDQEPLKSAAYLIELNEEDTPVGSFSFQYFPESFQDGKTVSWQTKEIVGGSLPLYQWASSGERTISFTATFTADIDYGKGIFPKERLISAGQIDRNVDIRAAVYELRRLLLPNYEAGKTIAPPRLMLYLPRSGIGLAGGQTALTATNTDSIVCVMTSCEVTWDKFFTSGAPRIATVSLAFAQVPQYKGLVTFPSRKTSGYTTYTPTRNGDNTTINSIRQYLLSRNLGGEDANKNDASQVAYAQAKFK
jgi:hypothetical protein